MPAKLSQAVGIDSRQQSPSRSWWLAGLGWVLAAGLGFCTAVILDELHLLPAKKTGAGQQPGPVDIGFAQSMSVHHDQAITLCQIVLSGGPSRVSELAQAIEAAQLIETGQMRGWLALWNQAPIPTTKRMEWLLKGRASPDAALLRYVADCNTAPGGMLGLATTVELNQLRSVDGDARDRLFLELMIRHHQGALPMAKFASLNAATTVVRSLATLDVMEQSQEVGRMQLQLQSLPK